MKDQLLTSLANLDPIVYIFGLAMLPLFEARYAIVVACILNKKYGNLPWFEAALLSILGNFIAVIPVLYTLPWADRILHRWQWSGRLMDYFLQRARSRKDLIDRHGFWGLTVFVALPVPVTGAWTGSLMAYVFAINKGKALLALLLGVIIATAIMGLAAYGGIEALSFFMPEVKL